LTQKKGGINATLPSCKKETRSSVKWSPKEPSSCHISLLTTEDLAQKHLKTLMGGFAVKDGAEGKKPVKEVLASNSAAGKREEADVWLGKNKTRKSWTR